jgi:CMP-N,N'-diacetyllegionaminic acid synthase
VVVGIVTARGGSRGLPGKNMVDLGGRPLIDYTFDVVQKCQRIERAFLSTDIPTAIALARRSYPKVEVPFARPPELCRDDTSQVAVVQHLLDHLELSEGLIPKVLVLMQPTSPFRKIEEIDLALKTFAELRLESMLGVARVLHHPADYLFRRTEGADSFEWVMRSPEWSRRQDFPSVYFNTGALYVCTTHYFRKYQRFYDQASHLFVMAEESALDIDTPFDLALAEGWHAHRKELRL